MNLSSASGAAHSDINTEAGSMEASFMPALPTDLYHLLAQAPVAFAVFRGPDLICELANDAYLPLVDKTRDALVGKPLFEALPQTRPVLEPIVRNLVQTAEPFPATEFEIIIDRNGQDEVCYFNSIWQPLRERNGIVNGFMVVAHEVTEQVLARKQKEQDASRLQQIQEETLAHMESLLKKAPIGFALFDKDHRYLRVNEMLAEINGIPVSDHIGKTIEHLMPETAKFIAPVLDKTFESKQRLLNLEVSGETPKDPGVRRHWLTSFYPVMNERNGNVDFVGAVVVEITDRLNAEAALKESEIEFRNFSNNIQNLAWIADAEGWIFWYNQRWYDYTGTTLSEMQSGGPVNVHHPEHIDRVTLFLQEAWQQDQPWELTFPLRRHDGEYRWFITQAVPVKDETGKVYRWIGTNTDIHEQKLAEERFRTLAETLPQLVWMTDASGNYEYASSQWVEYSGMDPREDQAWTTILHPEDHKQVMNAWSNCLANGTVYRAEARLKRKDESYRWHAVQGEPLRDDQGRIIKWIGAFTDVHEQRTMTDKLESLVAQRTSELQRSNDDLQQFAHVASHDMKEPVRKIRTFGDRLTVEFGWMLPDHANVYINKIEAAAKRMHAMIDGVLDYSSVSTTEPLFQNVDLSEIIRHIENDFEVLIHEKGAVIQQQHLPIVEGSGILLYQLFSNLINNSLKFSKADVIPQIQLSASPLTGSAAGHMFSLSPDTNYTQVLVQDNGIGFSQENAERIFKTFTRLNARDKYEGTGLGLALCKKIVERHHGTISAAGMPGMGAIFKVVLPLQQPVKKHESNVSEP